jgi:hypothetical protein
MKNYIQFLMGLVALSGGCMAMEVEAREGLKSLTLSEQALSSHLDEDEIDKLGEKILGGKLEKGEIEQYNIQEIAYWIQDNMYNGVVGFYSNNQFVKIAKSLAENKAVELEFDTAIVGKDSEPVKYISEIKVIDEQKVKEFLQRINDRAAEHNKKYPYL